jgi:spore coat protein U-like protein
MFWSKPMKQFFFKFLVAGVLVICGAAHAVTCNITTATSVPLSTLYASGAATNVTGTISGSCTPASAAERAYIFIGLDGGKPPAGRAMTRQNGTEPLNYQIYHRSATSGIWNEGTGVASNNTGAGGVLYRLANSAAVQNFSYVYYLNIPAGQTTAPAGIYDDLLITATIRLSTAGGLSTGTVLGSTIFGASASIVSSCYFSTSPSSLVLNYTSFTGTAVTGNSTFALSCTSGSPYTLAIGPPATGTALGIDYTLTLSAASGTGTASPQSFGVTGTAAANQAGTCATSTCSATNPHTITVTF